MPSLVAVPYPTRGQVLLEANFTDTPTATHICVTATDTVTGLVRQLHPYISYNTSGCIALSCGEAILWDTEISCGNPTVYCATAIGVDGEPLTTPADPLVSATFSAVAVASWPPADTGQTWTNTGGAAADYSGTGTRGQHAVTSTAVNRVSSIPMTTGNFEAQVTMYPAAVALTQPTEQWLMVRADAAGLNGYKVRIRYNTAATVDVIFERVVAGVPTTIGFDLAFMTYTAASAVNAKIQVWGNQISVKAWDATLPEPAYTITLTDSVYISGTLDLVSLRNAGNTNGTVNMQFDNLYVTDVCAEPVDVEVCTEEVTIACDGCFRLGNPVRPCDDVRVCMCADGVECGGEGGLTFVSMTPDTRASNSGLMTPVNDIYPIPMSRPRMKPTSILTVVPTSFDARDDLINLLAPGEPLLLRTTPEFGIGDRYLDIGDVPELYQIADMRIQPRIVQMPNAEVRAPVGPSLGVCGSRIADLCDVYNTWDEMAAAGLTFAALLRGDASDTPSGLATWAEINAENADWAALQAAETDWTDVLDGD